MTANGEERRFSYRQTAIHIYVAFLATAFGAACVLLPLHQRGPGWISGEAVLLFVFLFFVLILIIGVLLESDIEVNSVGISMYVLGRRWRAVNWSNIKQVRIMFVVFPTGFGCRKNKLYSLYVTDRPRSVFTRSGGACFSSTIVEFQALEEIVKSQIARWNIPVDDRTKPISR